jgi:protein NirF
MAALPLLAALPRPARAAEPVARGTGDLAVIVERADGAVLIVDTTHRRVLARVPDLGDLSHATAVFSRDARHAFVFGRDGGISKVDLLAGAVVRRVVQAGNSIGGAISQDGAVIAVGNYTPGGVRLFRSETLEQVADIPTGAKVVGVVSAPEQRFVFSLYEAGEIWLADAGDPETPDLRRFAEVGRLPYDGNVTGDGRWYIAGLFGEDGLALLDLWHPEHGVRRILDGYGRGGEPLPVYKMPHLEGWGMAGGLLFLPAVGHHVLLVVDTRDWREVARIPLQGQPVFAVARPDGRQVWVNFAHPRNDVVQVVDVPTLAVTRSIEPGRAVLHIEFSPRGEHAWISARDSDHVAVFDTRTLARIGTVPARKPSGIFMTARGQRLGR